MVEALLAAMLPAAGEVRAVFPIRSSSLTKERISRASGAQFAALGSMTSGGALAMDQAYRFSFVDLAVSVPCCNAQLSLNDLRYEWPAGFARFILEAQSPGAELTGERCAVVGKRIGLSTAEGLGTLLARWGQTCKSEERHGAFRTEVDAHKRIISPQAIVIAMFLLFPPTMLRTAELVACSGHRPWPTIPAETLSILQVAMLVLSAGAFISPYVLRRQLEQAAKRRSMVPGRPDLQLLLKGVTFAIAPTIYGLVIFLLGGPIQHFYYYAGASCLAVLAWSLYTLATERDSVGKDHER